VADEWTMVMELTAAGQLWIYTIFPFNPGFYARNLKRSKSKLRIWHHQNSCIIFDQIKLTAPNTVITTYFSNMSTKTLSLQNNNHHNTDDDTNVTWPERYVSIIGGVRLGYLGLKDLFSSPLSSIVKIGAGGYLLNRGITGHCELYTQIDKYMARPVNINIRSSFIIHKPRHEVYAFWRRFDNLPLFMSHLKRVELLSNDHSRWVLKLPISVASISWEAEVVKDTIDEMIGWSSLPGSIIYNSGKVRFRDAADGESTRVDVVITYQPPAGIVGASIGRILNPVFKNMVEKDVQNFKHYMDIDYATDTVNYL
jgi:uncharacterized membrane protein